MLSKNELRFLESPESFAPAYSRVLRHRIKTKKAELLKQLASLDNSGLNVTENCNGVTEFSNGQQKQQSLNQAAFAELRWAEPDLNRRPLARKANVLTKLDDRPLHFPYQCLI